MPPTQAQLVDHLIRMIEIRMLDPLEILLDGDDAIDALRTIVRTRAESWADRIINGDDQAAVGTIIRIVSTLYPGDAPFDPPLDWWQTPLGQVVARRAGHPTATSVSYAVAGAMLGITRQGVHDLVSRGKLTRHPEGGVVPDSIRTRLQNEGRTKRA